jgi:hypothetical protein
MDTSWIAATLSEHPEIGAVLVLALGVVLARVLSIGFARLAGWLDRLIARYSTTEAYVISPARLGLMRALVFWLTLALAVLVSLRLLGVGGFADAMDEMLALVPRFLVGLAIVGAGHLLGIILKGLVSTLTVTSGSTLAPRLAYAAVLTVAIVMGLQHTGIDTSFLTQLLLVFLVVSLGGLTLAFALGAREYVSNLIARADLERYQIGQRLRVGEHEGVIVEIRSTGLDLSTDLGIVSIPASTFASAVVVLMSDVTDE